MSGGGRVALPDPNRGVGDRGEGGSHQEIDAGIGMTAWSSHIRKHERAGQGKEGRWQDEAAGEYNRRMGEQRRMKHP